MSASTRTPVAIFAKVPRPGTVKTRLIPSIGAEKATRLYERCTTHVVKTALEAEVGPVELWCTPTILHPFFDGLGRAWHPTLRAQSNGNLGIRMMRTFEALLTGHTQAILIGSDCPSITAEDIRAAADALSAGENAVFIPTEDGGYALIGLRSVHSNLFDDVPWSTSSVMEVTRERLRDIDWSWKELPVRWDVDRPEDFQRLVADPRLGYLCDRIARPTPVPRLRAVS
jgi:rSAM/selenodomain-associated transferase 1